jgi:hypothetical protein
VVSLFPRFQREGINTVKCQLKVNVREEREVVEYVVSILRAKAQELIHQNSPACSQNNGSPSNALKACEVACGAASFTIEADRFNEKREM